MTRLDLTLLGGFRARLDPGSPLALPTRKAQALLAYLAMTAGRPHPRDKLANLLWGDMRPPQSRASLRQALTALRKGLGTSPALRIEAETVALDPAAVVVDVLTFETLVKSGDPVQLEQAVALYHGDILAGLALDEAPFEEWLLGERERLRELAMETLARLLAHQRKAGATEPAVQTALKLLALDPLQEPVHRTLMRLYVDLGRRAAALRQYQLCVSALEREISTEPEAETKALYQEILRQQAAPTAPSGAMVERAPAVAPAPAAPAPAPPPRPAHGAPAHEIPLFGRAAELAHLEEALERSMSGSGRLVAVLGEAGIGKSRLAAEVVAKAAARGCQVLVGRCYETEQALPFAPWVEALRSARLGDNAALLAGLAPAWRAELSRLLPEVGTAPPARADGDARHLFEAVAQVLLRLSHHHPLALLIEDLHWSDEMSVRLLAFAGRRLDAVHALVVVTAREEDLAQAPLLGQTMDELERDERLARVRLAPLSREETSSLTGRLVPPGTNGAELAAIEAEVWNASEGNPFVAFETAHALRQARGRSPGGGPLMPSRVRDLIAHRLERLPDRGRRLVAAAAVIGRQFDFALLQRAADLPELEAAQGVEELVRHRVLHQSGEGFEFTHDRIREVARADLLPPRRLILHRRIAESLEDLHAGHLVPHALALGTHYRAAEVWDRAALHLREAGHAAWRRLAKSDAAACFEQALDALDRLGDNAAMREDAFETHFALARVVYAIGDFPRALTEYRAAEDLAKTLGDDRRLCQVLGGMLYLLSSEGLHGEAAEAGERALALARSLDDLTLQAWTSVGLGRAYFALGRYRLGIERTRWIAETDVRTPLDAHVRPGALLPSVGSRTWLALCQARLGDYGPALERAQEAVAAADRARSPQDQVWANYSLARIHLARGDHAPAVPLLERAVAFSSHGEFPLYYSRVLASLGSAHALAGRMDQALELLGQAVEESRAIRLLFGYAIVVTYLGETLLWSGRVDEAGRAADEAVAVARERGERGDEAWALHLIAEVRAQRDPPDRAGAAAAYQSALAIAEALEMRPLEARCHLGLGEILRDDRDAARDHLARAATLFRELGIARWLAETEALIAAI